VLVCGGRQQVGNAGAPGISTRHFYMGSVQYIYYRYTRPSQGSGEYMPTLDHPALNATLWSRFRFNFTKPGSETNKVHTDHSNFADGPVANQFLELSRISENCPILAHQSQLQQRLMKTHSK
jgi:hypothetical protein